jgi:DNA-damage-inducible protein D
MDATRIAIFKGREIRKTIYKNEWWFSVVDVIRVLTDSDRPSVYWTAMKARMQIEGEFQLSTICRQLKLLAPDDKMRETDCANTNSMLRVMR